MIFRKCLNNEKKRKISHFGAFCFSALLFSLISGLFSSCSFPFSKKETIIIWSDRTEIASCVEAFNASHQKVQAVIVYKKSISLPPARDENNPDLIIGSWLKNPDTWKNFKPLDYLFLNQKIKAPKFYSGLLKYGSIWDNQYLLPVSFDLPAVIFSAKNETFVPQKLFLTTEEIKNIATDFNKKNKNGFFTKMGFAPNWNTDFLYLSAKLNNISITQKKNAYIWDKDSIQNTISYIKDWTNNSNGGAAREQDFAFKFLYTPAYKYIDSNHCLFAYTTVSSLFDTPAEQLRNISFRWISNNGLLPIEDNIVMAGIYKKSTQKFGADVFLTWLFQEETQRMLMDRTQSMNLQSSTFGVFGGFSSIVSVNERILPAYYQNLLGSIPVSGTLLPPNPFPQKWESLKSRVLIPYLSDAVQKDENDIGKSLDERTLDWTKQYN